MNAAPLSKKRFLTWLTFFTFGVGLWGFGQPWISLGNMMALGANILLISPAEKNRQIMGSEIVKMIGALAGLAILIWLMVKYLPDDFGKHQMTVYRLTALFVWLIIVPIVYRRYRRSAAALGNPLQHP